MRLKSLYISIQESWQPHPGAYSGSVEFTGKLGDVKVALDAELSAKVLAVVAVNLVDAAKEMGALLTSQVIDQVEGTRKLGVK